MLFKKRGIIYGILALTLTAFILFIIIMQDRFTNHTETVQKDSYIEQDKLDDKEEKTDVEEDKIDRPDELHVDKKEADKEPENKSEELRKNKENIKEQENEVTFTNKYVNVSSLNVRTDPNAQSSVIDVLTINQTIEAENTNTDNGWVKIRVNDIAGYVNSKYLSDDKTIIETSNTSSSETKKKTMETENKEKESTNKTSTTEDKDNNPQPIVKNDADKLHSVDGNNQLILVTSNGYGTSRATIQTFERDGSGKWQQVLNVPGFIGKNGFADSKVEGDGKSPTGKYSIGTAFGRAGNPGTKLPYKAITADDVWVDDSNSVLYNSWQSKEKTNDQWNSAENMDIELYTHGFVINYNTERVAGKGSAIFFHIANGHTLGCTGVSQSNMISILNWIDPAKNPVIIQTPDSGLGHY
ncbi:SH3 domain-containing protein [Virgibacillus sp. C22-A2]|uniref:SH3 domain-containing protein n=1 Tax=Virgibacillus tibetensis TaxID=3042313 RepID=A0ABU6KII6_9BACI|nr:SH3 domain-containing protein [Virgibacillus sp. C22-A2]